MLHTLGIGRRSLRASSRQGWALSSRGGVRGESALALVFDVERLPPRAGVLTPAAALAGPLVECLRKAGHTMEVHTAPD